jgi:uncharacterized membrane protein
MAQGDAVGHPAGGVRELRRGLEPVAIRQLVFTRWCEATAWLASILAAWAFAGFALRRHGSYQSTAYDFGFFDQIIWNTSKGRWFETSFVEYNFLGQHVEPVLLMFAGMYRLGAGPESLLVAQAAFVGLAAVPLFYATRRMTGMPLVALAIAGAYLLNPALHRALDFDFHPELMAPFWIFLGLYFLAAGRPVAAILAAAAVLLLKEDMAVVALMFAIVVWAHGWRRHGAALAAMAITWGTATVFVLMPMVRGGGSDLNQRFQYLVDGTAIWNVVPIAAWRGASHLADETLNGAVDLMAAGGWMALLSPAVVLAAPSAVLNGLSDHPQQAALDLQYGVASITLLAVATAFAARDIAGGRVLGVSIVARGRGTVPPIVPAFLVVTALAAFAFSSPYSPRNPHYGPGADHRDVIAAAMRSIPDDASVSAQNTLLPHLSQRERIYEFPDVPPHAEWVIVDASLPVTAQTRTSGYDRVLDELEAWGFALTFEQDGVRVYSRSVNR